MNCPVCGGDARQLDEDHYECLGPPTGSGYDVCGKRFGVRASDIAPSAPTSRVPHVPTELTMHDAYAELKRVHDEGRELVEATARREQQSRAAAFPGIREAQALFLTEMRAARKRPQPQRCSPSPPRRTGLSRKDVPSEELAMWHLALPHAHLGLEPNGQWWHFTPQEIYCRKLLDEELSGFGGPQDFVKAFATELLRYGVEPGEQRPTGLLRGWSLRPSEPQASFQTDYDRDKKRRVARVRRFQRTAVLLGIGAAIVAWTVLHAVTTSVLAAGGAGAVGFVISSLGKQLSTSPTGHRTHTPGTVISSLIVSLLISAPTGFLVGAAVGLFLD